MNDVVYHSRAISFSFLWICKKIMIKEGIVLYHSPENYKTIFQNIDAGDFGEGFIVWEVPKKWKKMTVTFRKYVW